MIASIPPTLSWFDPMGLVRVCLPVPAYNY
jgi:hypothetical protein